MSDDNVLTIERFEEAFEEYKKYNYDKKPVGIDITGRFYTQKEMDEIRDGGKK